MKNDKKDQGEGMTKLTIVALGILTVGLFATAGPSAVSAQSERSIAVHAAQDICRVIDADLEVESITFGECVNILPEHPASDNANNYNAGLCGINGVLIEVNATNKGQCLKIVRDLP